jgi:DNA-binding transcriptional LysR family regulator
MHGVQLEAVDLNLLKALEILLDERHLTRASVRAHLSQSAMSRTLTRLRGTFDDELLVRTPHGYELTPRARTIQRDLAFVLPRLRSLLRGAEFLPATATDTVRVDLSDYVTTILGAALFPRVFQAAPGISVHAEHLRPASFEDLEHGRTDLVLTPVRPPTPLRWRALFEERLVCVLSRDHPVTSARLSVAELARYPHASVVVLGTERMLVETRLATLGIPPRPGLRVPSFTAPLTAIPGTELIAVLPSRLLSGRSDPGLRVAAAPVEFEEFGYGMSWHPRLDADPLHGWFRNLVLDACLDLPDLDHAQ